MRNISRQCILSAVVLALTSSVAHAASEFECLIKPTQTINIKSPVIGLLDKVTVKRGDIVKAGQILASLESSSENAAVEYARFRSEMTATINMAENKLKFARSKYQRRKDLQNENFGSIQDLEETENELRAAEAELSISKENLELAKLEWKLQKSRLDIRTITSPIDGVVVEQNVFAGEVVEPGGNKTNILKLAQIDPLQVSVILPVAAFGQVTNGMKVNVKPERPIKGRYHAQVDVIDRVIDAASGTFNVFLKMPNPKLSIPAGIKCQASFPFDIK